MPKAKLFSGNGTRPPFKPSSPTPTNNLNVHKAIRTPTLVKAIMVTPNNIIDTYNVEKFPVSKLLSQNDQLYALTHLASPLPHITQMSSITPAPVITAIRAFTFIPKKYIVCKIVEATAKHLVIALVDSLSNSISTNHTIAALAPQITAIHSESEALAMTAQKTKDNLTTTLDKAEKLHYLARNK
ncbi:hypothetical protein EDD22DRAFT_951548 [Suillus occidentalis]|nr:hypothetical protein EDD22DRAFT_951548 [Suillus occidentalis]